MIKYSVIIPTLNEAEFIDATIKHVKSFREDFEIIIADGGSKDDTVQIAKKYGIKIINSKRGRGIQLNAGAADAEGDILIFLHADTKLPPNAFNLIDKYFSDPSIKVASFKLQFDIRNSILKISEWFTNFDLFFSNFGDQTIIVNKKFFYKLGQFAESPMFEDVDFFSRARKKTNIIKLPASVITSSRRLIKLGVLKAQILNGWYLLQYYFGVNPNKIYKKYYYL